PVPRAAATLDVTNRTYPCGFWPPAARGGGAVAPPRERRLNDRVRLRRDQCEHRRRPFREVEGTVERWSARPVPRRCPPGPGARVRLARGWSASPGLASDTQASRRTGCPRHRRRPAAVRRTRSRARGRTRGTPRSDAPALPGPLTSEQFPGRRRPTAV